MPVSTTPAGRVLKKGFVSIFWRAKAQLSHRWTVCHCSVAAHSILTIFNLPAPRRRVHCCSVGWRLSSNFHQCLARFLILLMLVPYHNMRKISSFIWLVVMAISL
jgi:hypothetical protein